MGYEVPQEAQRLLNRVRGDFESSERRHKNDRKRWEHWYSLYRSHQGFREEYQRASPPDRDVGLHDLKREQGAELFIPHSFETVEQVTPRAVSQLPIQPLGPRGDTNPRTVEHMRTLIEVQRQQISYPLILQDTAKSGFIYGLGIMKGPFWRTEKRMVPVLERGIQEEWVQGQRERTLFDDPDYEDVDIFDCFWDPFASSLRRPNCRFAIHRTWRNTAYCRKMLILGAAGNGAGWNNPFGYPPSEIEHLGTGKRYDEVHQQRMQASGHTDLDSSSDQLHEVWEYHDGEQVITILDRHVPVQVGPNPAWHGELPFHAFRPTTSGTKVLPGIGEIEPIEHLQMEINAMRSRRADNANFVMNRAYAYSDGFVDPDNLRIGPGIAIPVNGDPRDLLFPLPVEDIPASGYQEEANLLADIERTTGLRDQGTSTSDTATGAQIVHQAGSVRILNKAKRLTHEVVVPACDQQILLNQQQIVSKRTLTVPAEEPGVGGQKWRQVQLGPEELAGDMFALPIDDGSTMPDNVQQMRQDAQTLWQTGANNPLVDQRELLREVLRLGGVKQPDRFLLPDQRVPPGFLDLLVEKGVAPETVSELLQEAQEIEKKERGQSLGAPQQEAQAA